MKIFNNFDTDLKKNEYNEAVQTFWKENVILIQRHLSYWIIRWLIPLWIFILVSIWVFYLSFSYFYEWIPLLFWIVISAWILSTFVFIYRTLKIYIDYTMDFTIVTPSEILTHKQYSILNSDYKNFPSKKIRSVSSAREWFLWNIFWYGHILFLTDWSVWEENEKWRHWPWKILLTFVHRPNETRKKIMLLCIWDENIHYFKLDWNNNSKE